jgi:hypothetical protein
VTIEQVAKWDRRWPLVTNKLGRLQHAARTWLRGCDTFKERFESYLGNEQRKAAARKPKLTPEQKREAEQAQREREKKSDAAVAFMRAQDERLLLRRKLEARRAAPEEVERALREHAVAWCIERARCGYSLPFDVSIVEEAKRRALEDNEADPFPMDPRNIIAMFEGDANEEDRPRRRAS